MKNCKPELKRATTKKNAISDDGTAFFFVLFLACFFVYRDSELLHHFLPGADHGNVKTIDK
jgi:hypothetical protein